MDLTDIHRALERLDAVLVAAQAALDEDKVQAEYTHGLLTVTLPKAEKAKPKQIPVQVG